MKQSAGTPEGPDGFDGPRDGEFADFHRTLTEESLPGPDAPWMPDISGVRSHIRRVPSPW